MNPYLLFILVVLVLGYCLNLLIAVLEIRNLQPELPTEFKDVYSPEKYTKSQHYTRETTKFSIIEASVGLVVTLIFILAGGFNRLDIIARGCHMGPVGTGLLFTGLLILLTSILNLPFALYSTFSIEQRFGFNTTTVQTFVMDRIKSLLLTVVIGGPILALVLVFFARTGHAAWLYCWGAITICTLFLQFIAPVVIMPLFNKFTPIEEGDLKGRINEYAQKEDFAIQGIYTMDGSRRSTRLNAFFTGFGRFRRIVFFDTLIKLLNVDEIIAVLAHEMGHYKKKHIIKMMLASFIQMGIMLAILSLFLDNPMLFAAFGMEHMSVYAGLVFFGFLYAPISTLLGIFFNRISRKHEYEADAWAARTTGSATHMIAALKKLSVHNLSNLTPHPLNVMINYSHPPVLQRIRALTPGSNNVS